MGTYSEKEDMDPPQLLVDFGPEGFGGAYGVEEGVRRPVLHGVQHRQQVWIEVLRVDNGIGCCKALWSSFSEDHFWSFSSFRVVGSELCHWRPCLECCGSQGGLLIVGRVIKISSLELAEREDVLYCTRSMRRATVLGGKWRRGELCKNMNDENLNGTQPHTKSKTRNH